MWGREGGRRGGRWRECQRAGAGHPPTLTSNKGGELMREGAPADTCGYRPTPAIKPSNDPQKTLELNAPRLPLSDRVHVPPAPPCCRKIGAETFRDSIGFFGLFLWQKGIGFLGEGGGSLSVSCSYRLLKGSVIEQRFLIRLIK